MNVAHVQQLPGMVIATTWEDDPRTRELQERLAVAERQLREATEPPDVARMRRMEKMLTDVLEWLDSMVASRDGRLGWFIEALAGSIREVLYGPADK